MELSILVARILALVYIVIGIGVLVDQNYYRKLISDMQNNTSIIYLGGILALVIGFFLVTYHNIWEASWVVIVTVIGWIALIKGVVLLIFPSFMMRLMASIAKMKKFLVIEGISAVILGGILGYFGFIA